MKKGKKRKSELSENTRHLGLDAKAPKSEQETYN